MAYPDPALVTVTVPPFMVAFVSMPIALLDELADTTTVPLLRVAVPLMPVEEE
jgi:hypothetical protein